MLYMLKKQVLDKLIEMYSLAPMGYNLINVKGKSTTVLRYDLYEIDGFMFHRETSNSKNYLGNINKEISSKTETVYCLNNVKGVLNKFLNNELTVVNFLKTTTNVA